MNNVGPYLHVNINRLCLLYQQVDENMNRTRFRFIVSEKQRCKLSEIQEITNHIGGKYRKGLSKHGGNHSFQTRRPDVAVLKIIHMNVWVRIYEFRGVNVG